MNNVHLPPRSPGEEPSPGSRVAERPPHLGLTFLVLPLIAGCASTTRPPTLRGVTLSLQGLQSADDARRALEHVQRSHGVRTTQLSLYDAELAIIFDAERTAPNALAGVVREAGVEAEVGAGRGRWADSPRFPREADFEVIAPSGEYVELGPHLGRGKATVVIFSAPWCTACRETERWLVELARERGEVAFRKVVIADPTCDAAIGYFGDELVLPHLRVFDAAGRELASLRAPDRPTLERQLDAGGSGGAGGAGAQAEPAGPGDRP